MIEVDGGGVAAVNLDHPELSLIPVSQARGALRLVTPFIHDRSRDGCRLPYSLFATFAPGWFPAGFREMGGTISVYFEAAAAITVLVLLGQMLELRAWEQTGGAIRALLKLAPKTAHRLKDGGEDEEVALVLVQVGDRLRGLTRSTKNSARRYRQVFEDGAWPVA